jgi:HSP20 family protein
MANIIKSDPFNEIFRFEPFRDMEGFFPARLRRMLGEMSEPTIKLDVSEDDKAYHVKAELPGVKKEDIAVEIDGNHVSLAAEVKREMEGKKKDEKVVHSERYYGRQFRSFTLAQPIERQAAAATFTDGVLQLTLPKQAGKASARLTIQ